VDIEPKIAVSRGEMTLQGDKHKYITRKIVDKGIETDQGNYDKNTLPRSLGTTTTLDD
jgi:hypothetical protein